MVGWSVWAKSWFVIVEWFPVELVPPTPPSTPTFPSRALRHFEIFSRFTSESKPRQSPQTNFVSLGINQRSFAKESTNVSTISSCRCATIEGKQWSRFLLAALVSSPTIWSHHKKTIWSPYSHIVGTFLSFLVLYLSLQESQRKVVLLFNLNTVNHLKSLICPLLQTFLALFLVLSPPHHWPTAKNLLQPLFQPCSPTYPPLLQTVGLSLLLGNRTFYNWVVSPDLVVVDTVTRTLWLGEGGTQIVNIGHCKTKSRTPALKRGGRKAMTGNITFKSWLNNIKIMI